MGKPQKESLPYHLGRREVLILATDTPRRKKKKKKEKKRKERPLILSLRAEKNVKKRGRKKVRNTSTALVKKKEKGGVYQLSYHRKGAREWKCLFSFVLLLAKEGKGTACWLRRDPKGGRKKRASLYSLRETKKRRGESSYHIRKGEGAQRESTLVLEKKAYSSRKKIFLTYCPQAEEKKLFFLLRRN